MGYYDFDSHFWSPREVCVQAPKQATQARFLKVTQQVRTIFNTVFRPHMDVRIK